VSTTGDAATPTPGRWLRALALAHAALGTVVYRRELRAIAAEGVFDTVPYRSDRAAALWFVGSAFPGWLVGRFVDTSIAAGDYRSAQLAGVLGTLAGAGGAVLMPRSLSLLQVPICARIVLVARRLAAAETKTGG
jgi:hypothetical protein